MLLQSVLYEDIHGSLEGHHEVHGAEWPSLLVVSGCAPNELAAFDQPEELVEGFADATRYHERLGAQQGDPW